MKNIILRALLIFALTSVSTSMASEFIRGCYEKGRGLVQKLSQQSAEDKMFYGFGAAGASLAAPNPTSPLVLPAGACFGTMGFQDVLDKKAVPLLEQWGLLQKASGLVSKLPLSSDTIFMTLEGGAVVVLYLTAHPLAMGYFAIDFTRRGIKKWGTSRATSKQSTATPTAQNPSARKQY